MMESWAQGSVPTELPGTQLSLYESISCVFLFLFLFWIWSREKENLPAGRLLGIFLIWCFGLRFFFEFLKENQEPFEEGMLLNMGQILSIPMVLAGIAIVALSYRKKNIDRHELQKYFDTCGSHSGTRCGRLS